MVTNIVGAYARLMRAIEVSNSLLCVGLDIPWSKVPEWYKEKNGIPSGGEQVVSDLELNIAIAKCHADYVNQIVDATESSACAFKPNRAFYRGPIGSQALVQVVSHINKQYPDKFVVGDFKSGDIDNTQIQYAIEIFEDYGFDGATVNPYMGVDVIKPFATYTDKLTFVLALTSNPGSKDFQYERDASKRLLYRKVARKVALEWNEKVNLGLVVGATHVQELKIIRKQVGDYVPILIPGIGKQGGDLGKSVLYGTNSKGTNAIINNARAIIFASTGEDFAEKAAEVAKKYRDQINEFRQQKGAY